MNKQSNIQRKKLMNKIKTLIKESNINMPWELKEFLDDYNRNLLQFAPKMTIKELKQWINDAKNNFK